MAPLLPDDVHNLPCLIYRQAGIALDTWTFSVSGERHGVRISGPLILDDVAACIHASERGIGLFMLPRSLGARQINAGTLEVVLDSFSTNFPGLALYYPSLQQVLPKLRAFIDHVLAGRS
ncbi:LysR substrate-binding domain-containing protein [Pseudomonas sp. 21LCFQ010]|uniref:LysR substrate-binding domain-containing protein n=1 Tax=Pseudomonas sp. 21LCFQ010 TaxID=2957506 RepID=UPI00345321F5